MKKTFPQVREQAVAHLRRRDPVMRAVIKQVGPCLIRPRGNRFHSLVRAIVSQQISVHAARAILARLEAAVAPETVRADNLAALSDAEFRAIGLSTQKLGYMRSLSAHALEGTLRLARIGRLDDEAVIAELTQVKGIGVWTAQMFLMFTLGRPNVLPWDDLGIKQAIRNMHGLDELPDKAACERIAQPWRPYATFASWYCWRSLELE